MTTHTTTHTAGSEEFAARLLTYHPRHLCYTLIEDEPGDSVAFVHPEDPSGSSELTVGVHQVITARGWEGNLGEEIEPTGALLWHRTPLSSWTGTRAEFAAASPVVQAEALAVGPAYNAGRWGTHLGATLTAVSADGYVVMRDRVGKYAEDHLFDSLFAGTLMVADLPALSALAATVDRTTITTDDYLHHLIDAAGVAAEEVAEFHPTHLAMRTSDFGLWIGGWVRLSLTAAQIAERVPFTTTVCDLDNSQGLPLTDWSAYDLHAAACHQRGVALAAPVNVH